ncbi:hypothetical protein [Flavobacterium sp. GT3P67]|uniref:hypothetical protein n=1 Tax=Flavobacterium sp. GT3P67 TaxID=2541722 RepID=UPI00104FA2F2|nr:hypothetical protein [Flavobacterium sp. GT3P67]TDE53788.1 hypothetical protein E0H99_07160 [Flavobacterium sp. GT3P67]
METLQIDKANALKAHEEASTKGKSLLENLFGKKVFLKDVKDSIKNFDDVLENNGISREDFETSCKRLEPDEVAYRMAKLVCITFNEGWLPDWTNSNEYKYYPWFNMSSSSGVGFSDVDCGFWRANSCVGSRLCFKSADLAKHVGKLFEQEIYKPLFTI